MIEPRCLIKGSPRPPLFPECFAGRLKWFHGRRRPKRTRKEAAPARGRLRSLLRCTGAIPGNAGTILAFTRRRHDLWRRGRRCAKRLRLAARLTSYWKAAGVRAKAAHQGLATQQFRGCRRPNVGLPTDRRDQGGAPSRPRRTREVSPARWLTPSERRIST
jgi:hypothetical protein